MAEPHGSAWESSVNKQLGDLSASAERQARHFGVLEEKVSNLEGWSAEIKGDGRQTKWIVMAIGLSVIANWLFGNLPHIVRIFGG